MIKLVCVRKSESWSDGDEGGGGEVESSATDLGFDAGVWKAAACSSACNDSCAAPVGTRWWSEADFFPECDDRRWWGWDSTSSLSKTLITDDTGAALLSLTVADDEASAETELDEVEVFSSPWSLAETERRSPDFKETEEGIFRMKSIDSPEDAVATSCDLESIKLFEESLSSTSTVA